MSISALPSRGDTRVPKSVKPESLQSQTIQPPAPPVAPVVNPLEAKPLELPSAKDAASHYADRQNRKRQRQLEKANR